MATGLTDLDGVHAAATEGADLVHVADPALIAPIRAAHPDLGVSVAIQTSPLSGALAHLIALSPPSNSRDGPLNDVVVTTTRTERRRCHSDVVAVEPRPHFSTIRLTGSGSAASRPGLTGP